MLARSGELGCLDALCSWGVVGIFCISLDGFGTGAGDRLHQWMFATRSWQQTSGSRGVDNVFAQEWGPGVGAEIMGAG
ncbi:hypothetical protein [Actinophytocola sp.]|uniref:hypothetical protein n=1 Tax=Actinophytocola sp. TaxID=1872138 RepID=UPI002D80E0B9|nr:hypothetical protein [Actinophytocola sp.]HET9139076.1 hypothetical protein [Actinophytocola sp.]